jgi:hypothetical protein
VLAAGYFILSMRENNFCLGSEQMTFNTWLPTNQNKLLIVLITNHTHCKEFRKIRNGLSPLSCLLINGRASI